MNLAASAELGKAQLERLLVEEALAGAGQSFAALVRPHLPMLQRLALRTCRNRTMAEDIVQETLEIVFRSLYRYTPGTSFRAFIASIAVRRAHTVFRAEYRRAKWERLVPVFLRNMTPAEAFDATESEKLLRSALAKMPEKRREAALLRLEAGLSYGDIAEIMNTSEGSARVLVHLALKELKLLCEELFVKGAPA